MRGDGDIEELVVTTLANIRRGVADVANLWLKLPNLADTPPQNSWKSYSETNL
jgi:hypothetical protein